MIETLSGFLRLIGMALYDTNVALTSLLKLMGMAFYDIDPIIK